MHGPWNLQDHFVINMYCFTWCRGTKRSTFCNFCPLIVMARQLCAVRGIDLTNHFGLIVWYNQTAVGSCCCKKVCRTLHFILWDSTKSAGIRKKNAYYLNFYFSSCRQSPQIEEITIYLSLSEVGMQSTIYYWKTTMAGIVACKNQGFGPGHIFQA